jgi:6-phosphogluconolactonase
MGIIRRLLIGLTASLPRTHTHPRLAARPYKPSLGGTNPSIEPLEERQLLSANPGAVYALTNAASGNAVAVFDRAANGTLTPAGMVSTGGLGIGDGPDGEGLQSQGALTLGKGNHYLYAVNGGSADISVFEVKPRGLALVQRIASGGDRPISLTVHDGLLYALNYDRLVAPADSGNITGFTIRDDGRLAPLAGSTRSLGGVGTNPGEVAFSPDGGTLLVTEKATDQLVTYAVSRTGLAGPPVARPSGGDFPFSVAFGRHGVLVEADDFQDVPGLGAASSYVLSANSTLRLVSAAVPDFQDGACWVAVDKNGEYAYVTNTNNSVISAYRLGADGTLTRRDANGVTALTGGIKPRDLALSPDGRFLYVLNSASGTVAGFRINTGGGLTPLGVVGAIPAPGSNGLVAGGEDDAGAGGALPLSAAGTSGSGFPATNVDSGAFRILIGIAPPVVRVGPLSQGEDVNHPPGINGSRRQQVLILDQGLPRPSAATPAASLGRLQSQRTITVALPRVGEGMSGSPGFTIQEQVALGNGGAVAL